MSTNTSNKERRDWTVFLILLPIGILLMLVAGQIAIRIVPFWRVAGGMESSLDPETGSGNQPLLFQPLSFEILTPMSWLDTFLTPGPGGDGNFEFQPFVILEPSSTPSPAVNPTTSSTPPTPTSTPNPTASPTSAWTPPPPPDDDEDPPPPPPPPPPPALCTDGTANNQGSPLPCTYDPIPSPLIGSDLGSVPANYNQGPPSGNPPAIVPDGRYFIVTLSPSLQVNGPLDTNYDLAYYERDTGIDVDMDRVILSISMDDIT